MTDPWEENEHVQARVPVSRYRPFHPPSQRCETPSPDGSYERSRRASPAKLIRFSRNVIASFSRSQGGHVEAVSVCFLPQFPDQLAVPSSDQ